jgi:hypothetical protein
MMTEEDKQWATKVIVRGPGGVINYEAEIIIRALKAEGFTVEVTNECPEDHDGNVNVERMLEHRRNLRANDLEHKDNVVVVVDHLPWGG